MIKFLRASLSQHQQITVLGALALASGICVALWLARVAYTQSWSHEGLVWNLFLAWLPMGCAWATYSFAKYSTQLKWPFIVGGGGLWLLFFPNAPYLLTDIVHLWPQPEISYWYDFILIQAFGWTGAFLGLVSLFLMQTMTRQIAGKVAGWGLVMVAIGLGGFGIYLGRFLGWNSWDLFFSPLSLLQVIWDHVRHPLAHIRPLVFSALFSLFLLSAYLVVTALHQWPGENQPHKS